LPSSGSTSSANRLGSRDELTVVGRRNMAKCDLDEV
jgi:hypothetical protein